MPNTQELVNFFFGLGVINKSISEQILVFYEDEFSLIRASLILVISTVISIIVTLFSNPVENNHLINFYNKIKPKGYWKPISIQAKIKAKCIKLKFLS